jgi:monoamine oxidase
MNRREFLQKSVGAAAALTLLSPVQLVRASAPSRRVIVIGAGLAGLVSAYELGKLNFDVSVLEAQNRPGGRVLTLRNFSEGLSADAGAARIPDDHDHTLRYVSEFGLPLIPFYPTEDKFLRINDGRREAVGWDEFRDASGMVMFLDQPKKWRKIRGGNDLLPHAIARKLGERIIYDSPVSQINSTGNRVEVKFTSRGKLTGLSADYLICAVPATMLSKIDTVGAFSEQKIAATKAVRYDSASRVFLETKRRFWQDEKLNGFAFGSDYAEIWNLAFGQSGVHGILQSYIRGEHSIDITKRSAADRVSVIIERLSTLFPQLKSNFVQGVSKCWSEDPWTLGAWAHPSGNILASARAPEGRIFFAGEHLSTMPSWMQGAIESGLRVVKELTSFETRVQTSIQ